MALGLADQEKRVCCHSCWIWTLGGAWSRVFGDLLRYGGCPAESLDEVDVAEATPFLGWWSLVSDQAVNGGPVHHLGLISRWFTLESMSCPAVSLFTMSHIPSRLANVFCVFCVSWCVLASWAFCTGVVTTCLSEFKECSIQVKRRLWPHLRPLSAAQQPSVSGGNMIKCFVRLQSPQSVLVHLMAKNDRGNVESVY